MRSLLVLVLLAGVSTAQAPGDRVFDTRANPAYRTAPAALAAYLTREGGKGVHEFCVVGFQGGGWARAWVYWPKGHRIILWDEAADPKYATSLLLRSRRELDLDTDVVETEADIHGSSYLVTRAWVNRIRFTCARQGASYLVRRLVG